MKSGSNLEKVLEGGYFAVTTDVGPPKGTSASVIQKKGDLLKSSCDALNVTDNQTAIVRMSSSQARLSVQAIPAELLRDSQQITNTAIK